MRVLHVSNEFRDNATGITNCALTLAREQARGGDEVHLAGGAFDAGTHTGPGSSGGLMPHEVAMPARSLRGLSATLAGVLAMRRLLRRVRPDVVHCHTVRALVLVLAAAPRGRGRTTSTVHNEFQRSAGLMLLAARVVCPSAAVQDSLRRRYGRRLTRHTAVVLNAVRDDVATGDPHPAAGPRTVLYCGSLLERKGVRFLLDVFTDVAADVADATLLLLGNRDQPGVEAHATESPAAGRIVFGGFVPDPRPSMDRCAVLAVPSRAEPFGLVAGEARTRGLPVVASRVGGLVEVLGDDGGVLLDPDDRAGWARELRAVLTDDAHRADLARRSAAGAGFLGPAAMAAGYRAVYPRPRRASVGSTRRTA